MECWDENFKTVYPKKDILLSLPTSVCTLLVKLNHAFPLASQWRVLPLPHTLPPYTYFILQTTDPEGKLKSLMAKLLALSFNRLSFTPSVSNALLQSSFFESLQELKGYIFGVEKMRVE